MRFIISEKALEYLKEIKSDLTDIERKIVNLKLDDIELVKKGLKTFGSYKFVTNDEEINDYINDNDIDKEIDFHVEENGQLHTQLPDFLQNLGLGKKIYLKLVEKFGMIKSRNDRSEDAERLWKSLKKENVYYIFTKYNYYLISKDNEEIIPYIIENVENNNLEYESNIPEYLKIIED